MRSHAAVIGLALAACKGAERPRAAPAAAAQTVAATRDGFRLRGVAGDGTSLYASFGSNPGAEPTSTIEARRGTQVTWTTPVPGTAGELAIAGAQLAVTVGVRGPALRGDPAAALVALDRATGAKRWQLALESTDWALINAVAALGDDIVIAGAFSGTLRITDKVVTSGGGSDGFVARVSPDGKLGWVIRLGGAFADSVQGLAIASTAGKARIAIAGTFSLAADILGEPLKSIEEKVTYGDAFVAELDATGARKWSASFGSRADDSVAGVAIDNAGHVVVAANVREVLSLAGSALVPRGTGDGLVVWYTATGELGNGVLIGGNDFDGLRAIAALGDQIVVGGFFSGSIGLADQTFTAGGGDDSFLAALDRGGAITTAWHLGGSGREEITSLSPISGGVVVGMSYTGDGAVDDVKLIAPKPGSIGAALVVRGR